MFRIVKEYLLIYVYFLAENIVF